MNASFIYSLIQLLLCLHKGSGFNLTLLHVNDIHVRFEQTNKYSNLCKAKDEAAGECYGGVARLKKAVDDIKSTHKNVVFLNGGDFYQGNVWYTHFKWQVVSHFAEILNFTAMAPGNHEFDDHISGFLPFLANITFPIVCCNMDFSEVPELAKHVVPSVVVELEGRKVGIIGYLTTETPDISNPGKVKFVDEVTAVNAEAQKLKAQGVNILIGLGHSGYEMDKNIAINVPDIDVVVGGHSHSFLYTGEDLPSNDKPVGDYPTIITQPGLRNKKVPVVQAYAYTKYMGYMNLTFDDLGDLIHFEGKPLLLSQSMPQDTSVLKEMEPYKEKIKELSEIVIGSTLVLLEASRTEESNLGNFVTDSMVHWYAKKDTPDGHWTKVQIGLMNSGGIRSSFDVGNITNADILGVLPFQNTVDLIEIRGKFLRQTLEKAAGRMSSDGSNTDGGFLQISGLKVTIDLRKPAGQRLTSLKVHCAQCPIMEDASFLELDDESVYTVTLPSYIANGGNGNDILVANKISHIPGPLDTDVFKEYLEAKSPVVQGVEGRITIITADSSQSSSPCVISTITLLFIALVVVAVTYE